MFNDSSNEGSSGASEGFNSSRVGRLPSEAHFISFYAGQTRPEKDNRGVFMQPLAKANSYDLTTPVVTKTVYVAHPTKPNKLYAFADYEQAMVVEKLNEALRIMQALGASEVITYAYRGSVTDFEGKAGYTGFGANIQFSNSSGWEANVCYRGSGSAPVDPRPIAFPDEPGFDAVCDAVIKNGATEFQLEIMGGRKFSLDGSLAGPLRSAGFELGVVGKHVQASHFVLQAQFPPAKQDSTPRRFSSR